MGISIRWFALLFLVLNGCAPMSKTTDISPPSSKEWQSDIESRWGVKLLRISLTAGGQMIDLRYRVIDADKAKPLFQRENKPILIDESTGARFLVPESPKVGALRTTREPKPDRNYFIIFVNPGRYLKKGDKVTVVIGEFRAEHLVIE